jgi:peptidoglycan biosynthesis protein MviN/MurJ (putative lipid II flippase)
MKKLLAYGLGLFLSMVLVAPMALAQINLGGELNNVGGGIYGQAPQEELPQTIGKIVGIVLTFLGVVMVVIIIYAGFLYMTAGGDEGQVKKAKQWIVNSIIGLALILLAYSITSFVITRLGEATGVAQ